jgi:2-oxoglutarate dehydrogenase E2 component (dihydrolipoamide succinyltransferase)
MAAYEIVLPMMGEGLIEATITKWLRQEGDPVNEDDAVVEVATDKVDTEIPSPVKGIFSKKLFKEGDVVPIGKVIALIETDADAAGAKAKPAAPAEKETEIPKPVKEVPAAKPDKPVEAGVPGIPVEEAPEEAPAVPSDSRFYSPLVKSIARQENISAAELEKIPATGQDDRVTKQDILDYIKTRKSAPAAQPVATTATKPAIPVSREDTIVEMDRIRQLISNHMSKSWATSPHVTSFSEADMTAIVNWRENHKAAFEQRENQKLTFTPIIIEAIAKAVRDLPMMNVSVDGTRIIVHKRINVGMAVALPNYNLIVPVIRNADEKSLGGILKEVNDLAARARNNKLVPDEIAGGTISLTNLGSFGMLMGTPIINQPQTAIVAVGAIKKRAVVIETPSGDTIGVRHMMIFSVTHDHRVIDGALAGQFLAKLAFYLEKFDINQTI